jgi:hypothetical protein
LQRVGSKSALADFLRQLLAYAQPNLLPREAVAALLDLACGKPPSMAAAKGRAARPGSSGEGTDEEDSGEDGEAEEEEEDAQPSPPKAKGRKGRGAAAAAASAPAAAAGVAPADRQGAYDLCQRASKNFSGGLFAGQAPRLLAMLDSGAPALQALAAQLAARWARVRATCSRTGAPAGGAAGGAAAAAVAERPSRAAAAKGAPAAAVGDGDAAEVDALRAPLLAAAGSGVPKAAKHAVLAVHFLFGPAGAHVSGGVFYQRRKII